MLATYAVKCVVPTSSSLSGVYHASATTTTSTRALIAVGYGHLETHMLNNYCDGKTQDIVGGTGLWPLFVVV